MGGMGGMGGGMRSVPATGWPFTELKPNQTRNLPTRLVSITRPDLETGLRLPEKGEPLKLGDIRQVSDNPQIDKALRRLAADKAPTSLAQLVMWNVSGGLDWDTISQLSESWANTYELTLAKEFVERLDTLPAGETGRVLVQVEGMDSASEPVAAEVGKALDGKFILGLVARVAEIPARPAGPVLACRIRLKGNSALVQLASSDATARNWVQIGKFTVPVVAEGQKKFNVDKFSDGVAEGCLSRLVRAQVIKGSAAKDKGKTYYQIRIDNASPLVLNGIAMVGTGSSSDEKPKVLDGIAISPRRSFTVPAGEDVVRALGLKRGIKLMKLDLSGL
jgi:hypothetical protein